MKREISDRDLELVRKITKFNNVPSHDCDDIVSEVFCHVIDQNEKGVEFQNYEGWLFVVTKNEINNYYKKQKRREDIFCPIEVFGTNTSAFLHNDDIIDKMIKDTHMKEVIRVLDDVSREIIEMYYLYGYKIKEIAQILNKNENTVKTLKTRALNSLRETLSEESRMIT